MTPIPGPVRPLPPHDITRRCQKCQTFTPASVEYQRGIPLVHVSGGDVHLTRSNDDPRECLLRTCRDCGWAWLEACADATHRDEAP